MEDGGRRQRRGGHRHCSTWRGLRALLHAPEGGARLQVGQKAGIDREGDWATGKAEAQPSVQSTAKLPEGQGRLCRRWPPLNTSSRNSPKASLAEGLTALPGWESQVDKALMFTGCSCP